MEPPTAAKPTQKQISKYIMQKNFVFVKYEDCLRPNENSPGN